MVSKYGDEYKITAKDISDPRANAIMGALFMRDNAKALKQELGREPTPQELYLKHFLPGKAAKIIKAFETNPNQPAVNVFGVRAERHNPGIIKGKTVAQALSKLYGKLNRALKAYDSAGGDV